MESREVKTLLLLEAIGEEQCQSQRDLSKKIKMSLGFVNTFIKQLKIRGIFKTINLPGNRVKYTLTPKGFAEKANLEKRYLSYSIRYYNEIKRKVSEVLATFEKNAKQKIVFYGTGELCEITCVILWEQNNFNVKIIDNKKAGDTICGHKIYNESKIEEMDFDAVIIMDYENFSMIREKLIERYVPSYKIFSILF